MPLPHWLGSDLTVFQDWLFEKNRCKGCERKRAEKLRRGSQGGTVALGRPLIESKTFLLGPNSRFQSRDISDGKNVEDEKHWLSLRG